MANFGTTPPGAQKSRRLAVGVVAVVAALLWSQVMHRIVRSDFMELATSIQDDSFYYLIPAFRFWEHGQFTFDGTTHTYGFQPAYECLLTVLAYFFHDKENFIRAAMGLSALLYCGTGVLVTAIVAECIAPSSFWGRLVQPGIAAAAGILFLTTGTTLLSAITCKENALSGFLLAVALFWIPGARGELSGPRNEQRAFGFGLLVASLVLCRLLPTTLALSGLLSILAVRRTRAWKGFAVGVAAPIALWSAVAFSMFGQVIPASVRIKSASAGTALAALDMLKIAAGYTFHSIRFAVGQVSRFALPQPDASASWGFGAGSVLVTALAVGAVAGLLLCSLERWRSHTVATDWSRVETAIAWCAAMALCIYPIQAVLIASRRADEIYYYTWYVFDLPVLLHVAFGAASLALARRLEWPGLRGIRRYAYALSLALCVGLLGLSASRGLSFVWSLEPYRTFSLEDEGWQHSMVRSGWWLRDHVQLAPGERVACASCGALALVFPDQLVNLDGLASDVAADYLLNQPGKSIVPLLAKMGARYYVDVVDPQLQIQFDAVLHEESFRHGTYVVARLSP